VADGRYVTWDRWDAEHRALAERVAGLERFAGRLEGAEQEHRAMADRIGALEKAGQEGAERERGRRDRAWGVVTLILGGLVCPVVVTAIFTLIHLAAH